MSNGRGYGMMMSCFEKRLRESRIGIRRGVFIIRFGMTFIRGFCIDLFSRAVYREPKVNTILLYGQCDKW